MISRNERRKFSEWKATAHHHNIQTTGVAEADIRREFQASATCARTTEHRDWTRYACRSSEFLTDDAILIFLI